ncbi:protein translocase subunit SecF [Betaproteobacteria bacterium LSUCC0115]|nr:protein translocase subunit SecF [Burkholderiales bacterium LSUCC0115]
MEFFRIKNDIPFMRHAKLLNVISVVTFVAAIVFIAVRGLAFSIEFTGGTVMEVNYAQAAPVEKVRTAVVAMGYSDAQVQNFGSSRDVLIRLPLKGEESNAQAQKVFAGLVSLTPDNKAELRRVEFVGPQVGAELATDGLIALLFVIVGIMIYLALRFEWKFAVAAIVANLHDVVIILGFFAAFQWEFSLSVLAAILAVLGYSVNESVVVADRIRENFRRMRKASVTQVIDNAITRTMSRTIITHGTTETMVLGMLIFGGPVLFHFALALTIGIVFGIYSSIFVMAPITVWLGIKREDLVKPVKTKDEEVLSP